MVSRIRRSPRSPRAPKTPQPVQLAPPAPDRASVPDGFKVVLNRGRARSAGSPSPAATRLMPAQPALPPLSPVATPEEPPQGSPNGQPKRRFSLRRPHSGNAPPPALFVAAGAVGLLLLLGAVGVLAVRLMAGDRVLANVTVNGQNLGGLTRAEARERLVVALRPTVDAPLTLTYEARRWTPTRADLGVAVDFDATVAEAYGVGRTASPFAGLVQGWQARNGAVMNVPLTVSVDGPTLEAYLDRLQAGLGTPPTDATVTIKGGTVVVTPGTDGVRLDRELVHRRVLEEIAPLYTTTLALPVTFALPTISTDAANAARSRIEAWDAAPLTLTFGERQWEIGRDVLLGAMRIGPGPEFALKLDPAALRPRVNAVAGEIKQEPQNAVIGWDNALVVRTPAKAGQRLNTDDALARLGAWQGDERTFPLVVEVTQPRIPDDLSKLGITKRVAVGKSNFAGSDAARAKNIAVSAGYLDDTVVAPGETFSFLDAIGEISEERGYKKGYVILAEETVSGIGGGVCQVATTAFRAAVYSGLPIVERNPHAYIVRYYEQGGFPIGLDAAVFSPGVDLKFQNESNAYLLIKTAIDGAANLSITIYGPDLGYDVDLSDPTVSNKKEAPEDEYQIDPTLPPGSRKQVEYAKGGEDVSITRTVRKGGAVVREARFSSRYQAWPNKYLVSKDMAPNARGTEATRAPNNPTAASGTRAPAATTATVNPPVPNRTAPVATAAPAAAIPTARPATVAPTAPAATSVPPAPAATAAPTKPPAAATPVPTKPPTPPTAPMRPPATATPQPAAVRVV